MKFLIAFSALVAVAAAVPAHVGLLHAAPLVHAPIAASTYHTSHSAIVPVATKLHTTVHHAAPLIHAAPLHGAVLSHGVHGGYAGHGLGAPLALGHGIGHLGGLGLAYGGHRGLAYGGHGLH